MKSHPSSLALTGAALAAACLGLAAPAHAAPEDTAYISQIRTDTRNVQNGGHGLFTSVSTGAYANHVGDPKITTSSYFEASNVAYHSAQAEVRLAGVRHTIYQASVLGSSRRYGTSGYETMQTCATGSFRILGQEMLDETGACQIRTGSTARTVEDGYRHTATFFRANQAFTILGVPGTASLSASGTVDVGYAASAETGAMPSNYYGTERSFGSATVNAQADLTARGSVSLGIPYVASVGAEGTIRLLTLRFTPSQTSSRAANMWYGYYLLQSSAPFVIEALNGKIDVVARGPGNIVIERVNIWDPPAIARWSTSLINQNYDANFWFFPH